MRLRRRPLNKKSEPRKRLEREARTELRARRRLAPRFFLRCRTQKDFDWVVAWLSSAALGTLAIRPFLRRGSWATVGFRGGRWSVGDFGVAVRRTRHGRPVAFMGVTQAWNLPASACSPSVLADSVISHYNTVDDGVRKFGTVACGAVGARSIAMDVDRSAILQFEDVQMFGLNHLVAEGTDRNLSCWFFCRCHFF